mgnify:CR=1 FL=1
MTGAAIPGFVDVGGRRIRHRVLGDSGPVVVMVHGFGGSLDAWSANQAALAAGGRTVAALDLPGHGESSLDVGSGSLDELAACVRDYLDAQETVNEYVAQVSNFLDTWLPRFENDTRSYVTIAFGCTGGRHRSVYLAEKLAQHCREQGREDVLTYHRELE